MSAQPSAEDLAWHGQQRAREARNPRHKQQVRPVADPATGEQDRFDLTRNERILSETRDTMADRVEQLDEAVRAHVRAKVAWKIHFGRATKLLEGFGSKGRTNEDTRRAYAIAYHDEETREDGADLYRSYIETEGELDALRTALNVQQTVVSATQTLINHGARITGL
jgi:hypothetical protein